MINTSVGTVQLYFLVYALSSYLLKPDPSLNNNVFKSYFHFKCNRVLNQNIMMANDGI